MVLDITSEANSKNSNLNVYRRKAIAFMSFMYT